METQRAKIVQKVKTEGGSRYKVTLWRDGMVWQELLLKPTNQGLFTDDGKRYPYRFLKAD